MTSDRDALIEAAKGLLDRDADREGVLRFLRAKGCSKVDSISILIELAGVSLAEAKRVVHFSDAWRDVRENDEALHELMERAVDQLPAAPSRTSS